MTLQTRHARWLLKAGCATDLCTQADKYRSMHEFWADTKSATDMLELVGVLNCNRYMLTRSLLTAALKTIAHVDDARIAASVYEALHCDKHTQGDQQLVFRDELLASALRVGQYMVDQWQIQKRGGTYWGQAAALALYSISLQRTDDSQETKYYNDCLLVIGAIRDANLERIRQTIEAKGHPMDYDDGSVVEYLSNPWTTVLECVRINQVGEPQAKKFDNNPRIGE